MASPLYSSLLTSVQSGSLVKSFSHRSGLLKARSDIEGSISENTLLYGGVGSNKSFDETNIYSS